MSSFSILEVLVVFFIFFRFQSILKANSGDPDQMPRSLASDLGSHCLSMFPAYFNSLYSIMLEPKVIKLFS